VLTVKRPTREVCNPPDTPQASDGAKCCVKYRPKMGGETPKVTISGDEPTDSVRALAEAYARIEYAEENTDECLDELGTAKNAISVAQDRLFDAKVDRVREELTAGDGLEE
jgi:hypothetical protein